MQFIILILVAFPHFKQPPTIEEVVEDYIHTYQERDNWDHFLSLYSDSLMMKDINLNYECQDLAAFAEFYDWPNPDFKKVNASDKTFELEDIVIQDHKAVIRGKFTPFYWKEKLQDWNSSFVIVLYFNEDLRIIQQYDYIKYPTDILKLMGQ